MPGLGSVVSGAPLPCGRCRTPFTPSLVASRVGKAFGLLCPRCRKTEKAEKAEKKARKLKTEGEEK